MLQSTQDSNNIFYLLLKLYFFCRTQTLIRTLPHWRAQDTSRENMNLVPTQGHHITFVNQKMHMMHSIELKGS